MSDANPCPTCGYQIDRVERLNTENARLRAALTAFVSAWQTSKRPPEGVEFEAIELCGGMGAIRTFEQKEPR